MANLSRAGCCQEPGCSKPIKAKRLCGTHYSAWYREQNPGKIAAYNAKRRDGKPSRAEAKAERLRASKRCAECGDLFWRKDGRADWQWEKQSCCSMPCANALRNRTRPRSLGDLSRVDLGKARYMREYQRRRAMPRWAEKWERHRRDEDLAELAARSAVERGVQRLSEQPNRRSFIAGSCVDCGSPFVVIRGWWHGSVRCSGCTQRHWKGGNPLQRARQWGVAYEPIEARAIFERDGWRCQLCGCKVRQWKHGKLNLRGATLDHIVPMALGGDHVESNVQCACWACNCKKGARAHDRDQLRLPLVGAGS